MTVGRACLLMIAMATTGMQLRASDSLPDAASAISAEAIMARVAANQDALEAGRSRYVYVQHARVISKKGKAVMCEEVTDSQITPSEKGSHIAVLKLQGRLLKKHQYVTYTTLATNGHHDGPEAEPDGKAADAEKSGATTVEITDDTTDRDIVEGMRANLVENNSKDGINGALFPLTTRNQAEYRFELKGRERMNGRDVFHIVFRPRAHDDYGWKGDAFVDTTAYEPVVVSTDMAKKVPLAVRTLLGTDLPGLGFTVVYLPQEDGTWFPVNFSTEFKLHVLFFFTREILIDAQNRDFEKTHVSSRIAGAAIPVEP